MAYHLNSNNVVSDTIDGEVLAIRSDTGAYYSMTGPAATAWTALLSGVDLSELAVAIADHHGVGAETVEPELRVFAEALVDELLLVEADPSGGPVELPGETRATSWSAPAFERYTDMQDLLLFDPIHEVQAAGWPLVDRSNGE